MIHVEPFDPYEAFGAKIDRAKRHRVIKGGGRKLAMQCKRSKTVARADRADLHAHGWSEEPEPRRVPLGLLLGRHEDPLELWW